MPDEAVIQRRPARPHQCCVTHAGRVLHARCTEIEQNLQRVRAFSRENLHDFERRSRAISMPDKTVIRLRSAPTSCMLHNVCGARRPSFACALHRNRIKFAARSRENLHDFERRSRAISMPNEPMIWLRAAPTSCVLRNARRPSFCVEVGRVLHARCTEINKICSAFARFLPKMCTISNASVVQSRCQINQ